jgi:hypothetical protein
MLHRSLLAPLSLSLLALPLAAQVAPAGPFVGTDQEGFETQLTSSFDACVVGRVFGDQGDLCTPAGSLAHVTSNWWYGCGMEEHGGSYFFGAGGQWCEFTFDAPVSRFGGYFGNNSPLPGGTIEFYGTDGKLMGTDDIVAPNDCSWTWNGWRAGTTTGIQRIRVVGAFGNGGYVMMDDLEADFGPARGLLGIPGTVSVGRGGVQSLTLLADPTLAGRTYMIIGSVSGTAPGVWHVGVNVPLNLDAYLLATIQNPNPSYLPNSVGTLDAAGVGNAAFMLPPGSDSALIGLTVHHAGVVLDVQGAAVTLAEVTLAEAVTLMP